MIRRTLILELNLVNWERKKIKKALCAIHSKIEKRYNKARLIQNDLLLENIGNEVFVIENYLISLEKIRIDIEIYIELLKDGKINQRKKDAEFIFKQFEFVKNLIEPMIDTPYMGKYEALVFQSINRLNFVIDVYLEMEQSNKIFTSEYLVNQAINLKNHAFELLVTKNSYGRKKSFLQKFEKYNKQFKERGKK